jgi:hypothetical protein
VKGDPVPDSDHVARYVGGSLVHEGRVDGNAFLRRRYRDEAAPSVHWLEVLGGDVQLQLVELRRVNRLTPRPTAVFARLSVGRMRTFVAQHDPNGRDLTVIHDPMPPIPPRFPHDDPSHALIVGLPNPDDVPEAEAIGDLIAQAVLDTFPTMSAPAESAE